MSKLGAMIVCLVFAIPFGAIGAAASWVIYRMIDDGYRAEQWVGVRATVDAFDRGSVAYRYTFNGTEYRGDRMGTNPIGGRDNLDSWYFNVSTMLQQAKKSGKPVTVWVNPDNPAESMVDRTIRWKLLVFALPFALGFGGVGVGALFVLLRMVFAGKDAGAARSTRSSGLGAAWIFAFMWNVIAFPIAYIVVPGAVNRGEWMVLLVLLFPLIGVLLLWGAISSTITAIRNGIKRAFAPKATTFEQPVAATPAPRMNDGFARGMLDDPRASMAPAGGTGLIDTADEGLPPPPDPSLAQWEKLAGGKLTQDQRDQFDRMSPTMRRLTGGFAGWLGKMRDEQKLKDGQK